MEIQFHRLFSMPALEGLKLIRGYVKKYSIEDFGYVIDLIYKTEADASSFDLHAAIELHGIVSLDVDSSIDHYYRACIRDIVLRRVPVWAKLMTLGRTRFSKKLTRDEKSIFRQAGLLVSPPDEKVVEWWDEITGQVRLFKDLEKLEQARKAEKLSLEYEKNRLVAQSVFVEPIWTAIEDNTAGYDVLSFEAGSYGLNNKLIEVKSTIASPLRFYLSRNEWNHAVKFGSAYHFHIWDMKQVPPILHQKSFSDICPHIPIDSGKGEWKTVEIPLSIK